MARFAPSIFQALRFSALRQSPRADSPREWVGATRSSYKDQFHVIPYFAQLSEKQVATVVGIRLDHWQLGWSWERDILGSPR